MNYLSEVRDIKKSSYYMSILPKIKNLFTEKPAV